METKVEAPFKLADLFAERIPVEWVDENFGYTDAILQIYPSKKLVYMGKEYPRVAAKCHCVFCGCLFSPHFQGVERKSADFLSLVACVPCINQAIADSDKDLERESQSKRAYFLKALNAAFTGKTYDGPFAPQFAVVLPKVPQLYRGATLDKCACGFKIKNWLNTKGPCLVVGIPGCGKTYLCWATHRESLAAFKRSSMIAWPRLLELASQASGVGESAAEAKAQFHKFKISQMCILDDFGITGGLTAAQQNVVMDLIEHRNSNRLTTLITTSKDHVGLVDAVGDAICSRIQAGMNVQMVSKDRRRQ